MTESNNMESFQQELRRHIKQYDAIQEIEWKKITNHIIHQYHNIDSAPFQTGLNMIIITGPKLQTKYKWICTRHDLITQNLCSKPETCNNQERNTMPMHEKQWGTGTKSWGDTKDTTKTQQRKKMAKLIDQTNNSEIDLNRHNS
jgi:hypothetical protein